VFCAERLEPATWGSHLHAESLALTFCLKQRHLLSAPARMPRLGGVLYARPASLVFGMAVSNVLGMQS